MGNQITDSGPDGAELGISKLVMPRSQLTLSRTETEIQKFHSFEKQFCRQLLLVSIMKRLLASSKIKLSSKVLCI